MLSWKDNIIKEGKNNMALIGHAGYGFKVKLSDIRDPELIKLMNKEDFENWLDGDGCDEDGNPTEDVFRFLNEYDYVELIEAVARHSYPEIMADFPGYAEAEHNELCIVLKRTFSSAYGNAEMLAIDVTDAEKNLITEFARKYFGNPPVGLLFWAYYG